MNGSMPFVCTIRAKPGQSDFYFRCLVQNEASALHQAHQSYPGQDVVRCMHDVAAHNTWLIYSASESAFWSNKLGWVESLSVATRYSVDQRSAFDLPLAADNDASWYTRLACQYRGEHLQRSSHRVTS
jgi:hypothetical protein